jgi:hypothetical protein
MNKMSKKNRNKNQQNQKPQNTQSAAPQPQKPVTVEDVSSSKTSEEFEKKKKQLFEQLKKETEIIETEKTIKTQELEKTKDNIEKENETLAKIREEKEPLEKEYANLGEQLAEIKKEIENKTKTADTMLENTQAECTKMLDESKTKADELLSDAGKKSLKIISDAEEKAERENSEYVQKLNKKRDELKRQEEELDKRGIQLNSKEHDLELDKEALDELSAHTLKQKERYEKASPEKIKELEIALNDAQEKYTALESAHNEQRQKYYHAQLTLDGIQTDSGVSIKDFLSDYNDVKDRNEELERIHERYPDEESIKELEDAKEKCESLEVKIETLDRECMRYKDEVLANRTAQKELEIVSRTAEATKTLNEHLLKELESHKTALESRTGDTCPALTKVDSDVEETDFKNDLTKRQRRDGFSSLSAIVTHVKNYAGLGGETKVPLYYSDDDIRAFLAGMAVSRLLILQGMSGTGKSSLPRIFSEAISGFNRLIPVESSWRDRNELLGYYNDFNKKFNAKTFTIELYRSGKENCRNVPTFIVLDEMNISRIEYYFSDFLAILQETDKEKWLIELVSHDMRNIPMDISDEQKESIRIDNRTMYDIWERIEKSHEGDTKAKTTDEERTQLADYLSKRNLLTGAKDLIDGRKVRVPENVWFVGTANRDESTFEITDKVYDRAQVISLDKKGVAEKYESDVKQKKIDITVLLDIFNKAFREFSKGNEVADALNTLDKLLMENFDTSFGNRIVKQTTDFAAVFVAAGGKLEDALDYQISTKILRKVITSDDMDALEQLILAMDKYPKTEQLISKRIKELGK